MINQIVFTTMYNYFPILKAESKIGQCLVASRDSQMDRLFYPYLK